MPNASSVKPRENAKARAAYQVGLLHTLSIEIEALELLASKSDEQKKKKIAAIVGDRKKKLEKATLTRLRSLKEIEEFEAKRVRFDMTVEAQSY